MPLIIHADDFGRDESVSKCIAEVMVRGWCSETSLMVNMPYAEEAMALAREKGFVHKVGLHLNLSQGLPLTEGVKQFPILCNPNGTFNKRFHARQQSRFLLPIGVRWAIRDEIEAQLAKFRTFSGVMSHVDSHHHVHTDWVVYHELRDLAKQYCFGTMRLSATLHKVDFVKSLYKNFFNNDVRRHFSTTDEFDGYNANVLSTAYSGKTVEVMVHPNYAEDGTIMDYGKPYEDMVRAIGAANLGIEGM